MSMKVITTTHLKLHTFNQSHIPKEAMNRTAPRTIIPLLRYGMLLNNWDYLRISQSWSLVLAATLWSDRCCFWKDATLCHIVPCYWYITTTLQQSSCSVLSLLKMTDVRFASLLFPLVSLPPHCPTSCHVDPRCDTFSLVVRLRALLQPSNSVVLLFGYMNPSTFPCKSDWFWIACALLYYDMPRYNQVGNMVFHVIVGRGKLGWFWTCLTFENPVHVPVR